MRFDGTTRSASKQAMLYELGAVPVVADALDPEQVADAVAEARPEVIVHQLTAIGPVDTRHMERDFALTNRLRTEGTDHLLSAGQAAGVLRFVAQSNVALYARTGAAVKSEDDPYDPSPVPPMRANVEAIRHLEEAVLGADGTEGIVLRYGWVHGPGTSMAAGEESFELVRKRKFPLVGGAGAVWSFVHVADAAEADRGRDRARPPRRLQRGRRRHPAPVAEWLPVLAQTLGAKKPMRVPRLVGRLAAGEAGVVMMTELRGASNAKAKRELGWRPARTSWRRASQRDHRSRVARAPPNSGNPLLRAGFLEVEAAGTAPASAELRFDACYECSRRSRIWATGSVNPRGTSPAPHPLKMSPFG